MGKEIGFELREIVESTFAMGGRDNEGRIFSNFKSDFIPSSLYGTNIIRERSILKCVI